MQQNETTTRSEVTVRRSPRYGRFVIATIVIFVIVSFFLTYSTPAVGQFSSNQVFGYMILVSIVFGIIVGSILALVIDKLMARTARTAVAEKTDARVVDAGAAEAVAGANATAPDATAPDAAADIAAGADHGTATGDDGAPTASAVPEPPATAPTAQDDTSQR